MFAVIFWVFAAHQSDNVGAAEHNDGAMSEWNAVAICGESGRRMCANQMADNEMGRENNRVG